ncbi:DNA damage-inducible protein 1 [Diutina catenulata]
MQLSIAYESDIINVDISETLTVADFKAYLTAETEVEPAHQVILKDGKPIANDTQTLKEAGLVDHDMIQLTSKAAVSRPAPPVPSAGGVGSIPDDVVERERQNILNNPQLLQSLRSQNPAMEQVINDPTLFRQMMEQAVAMQGQAGGYQNTEEYQRLMENPDDPESQKRIMEMIQQEAIDENYNLAWEVTPELFTTISMLYVDMKIKGHPVQAFVDSGAQMTIISPRLAQEVGIDRLIDRRVQGEARGVGSSKIEGRIHSVPITLGDSEIELPCSFTVIDAGVDLLFGLDMLRRHRGIIDLAQDKLILGDGSVQARFLRENEIKSDLFAGKRDMGQAVGSSTGHATASQATGATPAAAAASAAAARASAPSQTQAPARAPPSNALSPEEEKGVEFLIGLGFSRPEAIQALRACNGNVDMAASMLFG